MPEVDTNITVRRRTSGSCSSVAVAQVISIRLPTAIALVRSQVGPCEICGGFSGTNASFLRILPFVPPVHIPELLILG